MITDEELGKLFSYHFEGSEYVFSHGAVKFIGDDKVIKVIASFSFIGPVKESEMMKVAQTMARCFLKTAIINSNEKH